MRSRCTGLGGRMRTEVDQQKQKLVDCSFVPLPVARRTVANLKYNLFRKQLLYETVASGCKQFSSKNETETSRAGSARTDRLASALHVRVDESSLRSDATNRPVDRNVLSFSDGESFTRDQEKPRLRNKHKADAEQPIVRKTVYTKFNYPWFKKKGSIP